MYCFQCQETARNVACTVRGVCGKTEETARLQDLLIFVLKGIGVWGEKLQSLGVHDRNAGLLVAKALFATITNANFDNDDFTAFIEEALDVRDNLRDRFLAAYRNAHGEDFQGQLPDAALWRDEPEAFLEKAGSVGILATQDEDVRSLRELLVIGLKGIAAYAEHAALLGYEEDDIYEFMMEALGAKSIFIVDDKTTYSQGLADGVEKSAKKNGRPIRPLL